jgi:hypothetical protein
MISFSRAVTACMAALMLAASATPVFAHDDAYLDSLKSVNGGKCVWLVHIITNW